MKAIIHEMLITDEGIWQGDTYEVDNLNEELERLDQKGVIYSIGAGCTNVKRECIEIIINIFI